MDYIQKKIDIFMKEHKLSEVLHIRLLDLVSADKRKREYEFWQVNKGKEVTNNG